jgi:L-alanine-DL-glutamate epimerase-like enolase superfamily enzyme
MKIKRITPYVAALPLRRPMKTGGKELAAVDNIFVRIETDDGIVGWGEASAAPRMTGETAASIVAAIDYLTPALEGCDPREFASNVALMDKQMYGNASAKTALELALYDIAGKHAGKPVAELLGGVVRTRMPVLWMLASGETDADIADGRSKIAAGFTAFKIKVGINPVEADIERATAIRAAMPGVQISADANQGWTVEQAVRFVEGVGSALDFIEQPVMGHDLEGMARVARRAAAPICADEGLHSNADIQRHHDSGAARGGSLKMIKLGGLTRTFEALQMCGALGLSINLAGKIAESSLANAGVLHLASAAPNLNWGLSATQQYLETDIVCDAINVVDGHVMRPNGPGLGVEVDEAALGVFLKR